MIGSARHGYNQQCLYQDAYGEGVHGKARSVDFNT